MGDAVSQAPGLHFAQCRRQRAGDFLLGGDLTGFKFCFLNNAGFEYRQGAGNIAHFVWLVLAGDGDVEIAPRHRSHRFAQSAQGQNDPFAEHHVNAQPDQHGRKANDDIITQRRRDMPFGRQFIGFGLSLIIGDLGIQRAADILRPRFLPGSD